jgi:hypothetical protein
MKAANTASMMLTLKKRATTFGANNFVIEPTSNTGLRAVYFFCSPEIPLYAHPSGSASVVTGTDPGSTKADHEKFGQAS